MSNVPSQCPRCGATKIIKSGKHYCPKGIVQRFQCKICGTTFSHDGYFRGKHPLALLQFAASLYKNGSSYEKVQSKIYNQFNIKISRTTIKKWIEKLGVVPRPQSSGDQKNTIIRELVEIGILTTIRVVNSKNPEKSHVLQNETFTLFEAVQT
jgi:transposase-like protein